MPTLKNGPKGGSVKSLPRPGFVDNGIPFPELKEPSWYGDFKNRYKEYVADPVNSLSNDQKSGGIGGYSVRDKLKEKLKETNPDIDKSLLEKSITSKDKEFSALKSFNEGMMEAFPASPTATANSKLAPLKRAGVDIKSCIPALTSFPIDFSLGMLLPSLADLIDMLPNITFGRGKPLFNLPDSINLFGGDISLKKLKFGGLKLDMMLGIKLKKGKTINIPIPTLPSLPNINLGLPRIGCK